jgi:hypothetical protein
VGGVNRRSRRCIDALVRGKGHFDGDSVSLSLSASWGGHEDGHSVAVAGERGQVTQFHVPWSRPGPAPGTVDMVLALAAIHGANASWVGSMSLTSVIFRPMASDVTGSRP